MFEIILSARQLIQTIKIAEGIEKYKISRSDYARLLQLIDECLFVVPSFEIVDVLQELSSISEEYTYWCSQHLCHKGDSQNDNPFSITLNKDCSSIFHSDIAALIFEDEVDVSTSSNLTYLLNGIRSLPEKISKIVDVVNNEIIIYDPFLFDDYTSIIQTVKVLRESYIYAIDEFKIIFIGSSKVPGVTDSKYRSFSQEVVDVFGSDFKFSIIKIGNTYHDREFISSITRVKSGDSFTWVKRKIGVSSSSRGSSILSMSNLFKNRLYHSRRLINCFFLEIEARYKNPRLSATSKLEGVLSEVYFNSNFYRHWKISEVDL